jgi:hypothetical protein
MNLESFSRVLTAFESAFPGAAPPTWNEAKDFSEQQMTLAIDAVAKNPRSKFSRVKSPLVMQAARKMKPKLRPQRKRQERRFA